MFNLAHRLLIILLLVFCCVVQFKAQIQSSLTIEQAKNKLEQLQSEYAEIDEIFNEKIDTEVKKQISTAPKGEFESTQQYNARLIKAETLRKKLQTQYAVERKRQQNEIRKQIKSILDLEFTKPVVITLETYDADEEVFPVTVKDESKEKIFKDFFYISRNEARAFKENFSEAQKQGLFGVAMNKGEAVEYYYGFRVNLKGKQYTSLPEKLVLSPKQLQQHYGVYKDPYVIYTRKVFNAYLKNPQNVSELEREVLDTIDRDYLQSKFIVYSIEPFIAGGKFIKIVFQDKPDEIFAIWVYRIFELRAMEAEETDSRFMRLIQIRYKSFIDDKIHSL